MGSVLRPGLALLVSAIVGCGNADDRPPPVACSGDGCIQKGPTTSPPAARPGAGDGGVPLVDAGPTTTLSGAVRVLVDEQFSGTTDFIGEGVAGAEGPIRRVEVEFAGASFSLAGALPDPAVWADVRAVATSLDVLTTIQRVDATAAPVDLLFVQTATIDDIAAGLASPLVVDAARGHAVLTFRDSAGAGVSGVVIASHSGQAVAYDIGSGIFRDDQLETTAAGRAVVLNAQALGFPGSVTRFTFTGSVSGAVDVKLAGGAATLVDVEIE